MTDQEKSQDRAIEGVNAPDKKFELPEPINSETHWKCEVHGVICKYSSPCYECVREVAHPEIIESDSVHDYANRRRNARPRVRRKP